MRKVTRGTTPPSLLTTDELARATIYYDKLAKAAAAAAKKAAKAAAKAAAAPAVPAGPPAKPKKKKAAPKPFEFAAYKAEDVLLSLEDSFHRKCAYCESRYATTAPVDIDHFRPKGRIHGERGHGYWWLAMDWDNLLPSCIDCNRRRGQSTPDHAAGPAGLALDAAGAFNAAQKINTGKGDVFPILGARLAAGSTVVGPEQAVLIDPCRDNPHEHLRFHIDRTAPLGLLLPRATVKGADAVPYLDPDASWAKVHGHACMVGVSARGAVSIQVYGLNRLQLVRERTRILRRLEFLEQLVIKIDAVIEELRGPHCGALCSAAKERAIASLHTMHDSVLEQIREMAADDAPYSVMVKTWCRDFVRRLA